MGNQIEHCQPLSIARLTPKNNPAKRDKRGISHEPGLRHLSRPTLTTSGSSDISINKHRKFLSLVKESSCLTDQQDRTSDGLRQQQDAFIRPTIQQQLRPKHSLAKMINYHDQHSWSRRGSKDQSNRVRPRDLPRHSSQKHLFSTPLTPQPSLRLAPSLQSLQKGVAEGFYDPSVVVRSNSRAKTCAFDKVNGCVIVGGPISQWSIPGFRSTCGLSESETKKLKKVPLARSFQLNLAAGNSQNQEQSIMVKQASEMSILKHNCKEDTKLNITASKTESVCPSTHNKENQANLPPQHKELAASIIRQAESKYAVSFQQNTSAIQTMIRNKPFSQSILKESFLNKYSVAKDSNSSKEDPTRGQFEAKLQDKLEDKVEKEVESQQYIEEAPFRFGTATDFSYEDGSNPSFLPIKKRSEEGSVTYIKLEGEELLQYCRPTIDSKVMADLLRIPLKF